MRWLFYQANIGLMNLHNQTYHFVDDGLIVGHHLQLHDVLNHALK